MAAADGVSECTHTVVALIGMSLPAVVVTTCSRMTRNTLAAAFTGSTASCTRLRIRLPSPVIFKVGIKFGNEFDALSSVSGLVGRECHSEDGHFERKHG